MMVSWRVVLFITPVLLTGCVPYAGYYYRPIYPAYPGPYGQSAEGAASECRPVSMKATIDGRQEDVTGTVCRGPDGAWHVVPGAPGQ